MSLASRGVPLLHFSPRGVEASKRHAVPTLLLRVAIDDESRHEIRAMTLTADVRIVAERRLYRAPERERLRDVFGEPEMWHRSLRPLEWLQATLNVAPFTGSAEVEIPLPCSYDFDVVAAKYLAAIDGGEIPTEVLFRGSTYYIDSDGRLQTAMLAWETGFPLRIPAALWREAVDAAFPDSAWIRLGREMLARLQAYRSSAVHAGWDETFAALLEQAES